MSIKIEFLEETEDVYDIEVEDNNNFFANDILVHNCEITLPTIALNNVDDNDAMIALCTLSAVNWGKIKHPSDFEKISTLIVRGLDALLSYQNYPLNSAYNSTMKYRPLGIGINNLAYWMAKNDMTYTNPNLELIHEYAEAWSYYLIKASVDLAKEFGACAGKESVKYTYGIFPIDTYKRDVDELVKPVYKMDWESLRSDVEKFGIRNATLHALMPSETSSQLMNSTNGIEPPRSYITVKQSKDGVLSQVVPEFKKLKNKYELLWDQQSPEGYLKIVAVLQKFIDQAISVNTSYNPIHYENEKIPLSDMINHLLMHYKYGGKTLYYFNTYDGAGEIDANTETKQSTEEDCDSCKI